MIRRRAPSGLTLIEVIFAIGILGLIGTLSYMSFGPTMNLMTRVNNERSDQRRTRIIFQRMEAEFRAAFLGVYRASNLRNCELDKSDCPYKFIGENSGDLDEVTFTSLAGRPLGQKAQSDQIWLRYYVEKDQDASKDTGKPVMALWREERPIHHGDFDDTVPLKRLIVSNVTRFDLCYIDRGTTNDCLDDWDSSRGVDDTETDHLPRAVEISIKYGEGDDDQSEIRTSVVLQFSEELKEDEK